MRYLGVDPGGRRIGIAVGDDVTGIATPLRIIVVSDTKARLEEIVAAMGRHGAEKVVLGFPTREDGSPTAACARSELLANALEARGVPIVRQSEFLSTREARRRAAEAGVPRGAAVDHFAAQIILEEFLQVAMKDRNP